MVENQTLQRHQFFILAWVICSVFRLWWCRTKIVQETNTAVALRQTVKQSHLLEKSNLTSRDGWSDRADLNNEELRLDQPSCTDAQTCVMAATPDLVYKSDDPTNFLRIIRSSSTIRWTSLRTELSDLRNLQTVYRNPETPSRLIYAPSLNASDKNAMF